MNSSRIARSVLEGVTMVAVAVAAITLSGCTLCQDCGDLDYPTYGGAWERTRRDSGRVGSIFDPAGARTATLADRDESTKPDDGRPSSRIAPEAGRSDMRRSEPDKPMPDDPRNELLEQNGPSSSDREAKDSDRPPSLELDSINTETSDLEPPDL